MITRSSTLRTFPTRPEGNTGSVANPLVARTKPKINHCSKRFRKSATVKSTKLGTTLSAPISRRSASRLLSAIPKHFIPAAFAAITPETESSKQTESLGATPERCAARRKMAASGLPCFTSSPVTTTLKYLRRSRFSSKLLTRLRPQQDATAMGIEVAASFSRNSGTPGIVSIFFDSSWKNNSFCQP
jgi:hypothetical protein